MGRNGFKEPHSPKSTWFSSPSLPIWQPTYHYVQYRTVQHSTAVSMKITERHPFYYCPGCVSSGAQPTKVVPYFSIKKLKFYKISAK